MKPDKIKLTVVAVFSGLALGFIFAFVMEFLDHSFKESSDIEKFLSLTVIGRIPLVGVAAAKSPKKKKAKAS